MNLRKLKLILWIIKTDVDRYVRVRDRGRHRVQPIARPEGKRPKTKL